MASDAPTREIGLYGKIPTQGDFVRVHAGDPAVQALDQWIQEGLEALQRVGAALPAPTVFFGFRPGGASALVGAFVPSHDKVGRSYPLVLFARVDAAAVVGRFPALPVAFGPFLQGAAAVLAAPADAATLTARAKALHLPSPAELSHADAVCRRVLDGTSAGELHRRLFPNATPEHGYFAFKTFLEACDTARGRPPPRAAITLDCPIASDMDLFTWLELSRRRLQWAGTMPPFFWCEGDAPRLLLPLGPPPAATLRYLARPADGAAQLWPLVTQRAEALAQAGRAFAPQYKRVLDQADAPLELLLATLAR